MITTIYGSVDGCAYGESTTYSTARTTGAAALSTNIVAGQELAGSTYRCYEGFFQFNCSALGGYGKFVVTDVDVFLKVSDKRDTTAFTFNVVARNYGTTLTSGDFVSGASISGTVMFADSSSLFVDEAYRQLTQASAWDSAALINYSGTSSAIMYMAYSSRHVAGTTPTGDEELVFYSSSASGTTSDPYAIVEWYSTEPVAGNLHGALGAPTAWNRVLSAVEVRDVMNLGMTINDRVQDNGQVTIEKVVRTRAGTLVPATHVQAGWWIENQEYRPYPDDKPRPLLIQAHNVDLQAGKNVLTIGIDYTEKELGMKIADLLAEPDPSSLSADQEAAIDPYQPEAYEGNSTEESATPEETAPPTGDEHIPTYWEGYPTEEAYLKRHPWMRGLPGTGTSTT